MSNNGDGVYKLLYRWASVVFFGEVLEDGPFLAMAGDAFGEAHGRHSHVSMRAASLMRAFEVVYHHTLLQVISDGEGVILHDEVGSFSVFVVNNELQVFCGIGGSGIALYR